jgi:SAM-dependent methyltransferase
VVDADLAAFVRANLPPPPARLLEVGAGGGELALELAAAGYDVVAVDPASEVEHVRPIALADVDEPDASFDAALAVVSLHHVEPLEASLAHLSALVRPGGRLVVDELDVAVFDERAAGWWIEQRAMLPDPHDVTAHDLSHRMREHLHPLARICDALAGGFALGEPVRGPYLYRWELGPERRAPELAAIWAGTLPAIGARLIGLRR